MFSKRNIYLAIVSLLGLVLFALSILFLPTYYSSMYGPFIFFLLLILGIAAQLTSTFLIGENVIVDVSTAVSMATVALYGPFAGSLVAACAATAVILNTLRLNWPGWQGAAERIGFNLGMVTIAIFVAGTVFTSTSTWLGDNAMLANTLPWLLAAVINDQLNLWILVMLLHLQSQATPVEIWQQHRWAIPINVLIMSIGGGVLAFAVRQFDFIGIAIFFLPIVLSAYAFRLYVNQTKQQMERLEDLVAMRTNDLREANQELEELNKTKNAFLAVLTHDMRTPLSSIKSYAGLLSRGGLSSEQQQHISSILMRSQDSLMEIVNNILEIEKLQSGIPIELEKTYFDLAYLTSLVSETLVAQASEKDITIVYDPDPSSLMVSGDREKIKRVVTNLVANAVKYTEDGGKVMVNVHATNGYAEVNVTDTGYGIPADELPHIFERFRRVKGHRHIAVGTGLGLAIAKSLIEAHNGHISVASREGQGSTFTIQLPIQIPEQESSPVAAS